MSTFPYKGWEGGLLTLFLEISLWFFACRPELWFSFWIKNFRHFLKNFVLGPCGLSKVINIWSGNSILDKAFPPLLIRFPTPFPHFPPPKGQISLPTFLLEISLWFFACRPELWFSFWIKNQSGGKITFPLIFPAFFRHFFKNFVLGLKQLYLCYIGIHLNFKWLHIT